MLAKLTICTACLFGVVLPAHADYLRIDSGNFSLRIGTPARPNYHNFYNYHHYHPHFRSHIPLHHPHYFPYHPQVVPVAPKPPSVIVVPPGSTVIITPDTRVIQRSHIGIIDRLHQIGHPVYQGF